jgi:signal transduction histidine kinase
VLCFWPRATGSNGAAMVASSALIRSRHVTAGPSPASAVPTRGRALHTESMLRTITWLVRLGASALIGVLTFAYSDAPSGQLPMQIVAFGLGVTVIAYWLMVDLRRDPLPGRAWGLPLALGAMGATAGLACTTDHGGPLIGFAIIAAIAAGTDASLIAGWTITGTAILGIEIGALFTDVGTASVLGYPLLLLVAFVGGRNRAAYRVQAEQSAAMVAQLEQLRAQQRRAAVFEERTRIAREIHDVLAHSLGALGIQIQATRAVLDEQHDVGKAIQLLDQAQRLAKDGLRETRRAVQALRADSARLDEQIAELVDTHRTRHRASVDYRVAGDPGALPPEATVALVRTAQEALVNSAKHARDEPVGIDLCYRDDSVRLVISNALPRNGPYAEETEDAFGTANGGYGLTGMRERLLLINGTLSTTTDAHRWTVTAQVPR